MANPNQNIGQYAFADQLAADPRKDYPPAGNWPAKYGQALANIPGTGTRPDGKAWTQEDLDKYKVGIKYFQGDPSKLIGEATWNPKAYSGILIPKIWSAILNFKFHDSTVIEHLVNTRWQHEFLEMGNSVTIRNALDAKVQRAENSHQEVLYDRVAYEQNTLKINNMLYVALANDEVAEFQSDMNYMVEYFNNAAIQMALDVDRDVLEAMPVFSHPMNSGHTAGKVFRRYNLGTATDPVKVNKGNVLDLLSTMQTVLREQSIPNVSQFVVIPPAIHNMMMLSDLKDASFSGDRISNIRGSGFIGNIAGFDIYVSNQLAPSGNGVYSIPFGHPTAVTFAGQMKMFEGPLRDPRNWIDHYRMRFVYGFDAVQREALGHACVQAQNLF